MVNTGWETNKAKTSVHCLDMDSLTKSAWGMVRACRHAGRLA